MFSVDKQQMEGNSLKLYDIASLIYYDAVGKRIIIEIRIADRWYASSKTCHVCGYINKDLGLKDREWKCPSCESMIDRDYNASLNLRDTEKYKIA